MSSLIDGLRGLNVLVVHPRDGETEELLKQISRIGCNATTAWPFPVMIPDGTDLIFMEITYPLQENAVRLLGNDAASAPTVIGIIAYENPSVLKGIIDLKIDTVLAKPIRPFGVLSHMLMARSVWIAKKRDEEEIQKLRRKIQAIQKIADAKFILMRHHGINETDAYKIIRSQAMAKRTSTLEIAQSVINAESILSGMAPRDAFAQPVQDASED